MPLISVEQALEEAEGPLSRRVLEYVNRSKQFFSRGKEQTVTPADLAPLGELLDLERFERIGGPGETTNWEQYTGMLCSFANASVWEGQFRRITEVPGRAILELQEKGSRRDGSNAFVVNSVTIYEFDDSERLVRLWVYLQGKSH